MHVPKATEAERKGFFDGLKDAGMGYKWIKVSLCSFNLLVYLRQLLSHHCLITGGKSAVLSVLPDYNQQWRYASLGLPPPLTKLFNEDFSSFEYGDLVEKCEETFMEMSISAEEVLLISNLMIHNTYIHHVFIMYGFFIIIKNVNMIVDTSNTVFMMNFVFIYFDQ